MPNEAESHALLAKVRQEQDRWPEAISHWRQVAKLRALEPTGLLNLAAAQVHEGQFSAASDTVGRLKARTWPPQFPDAFRQIEDLERQLPKK